MTHLHMFSCTLHQLHAVFVCNTKTEEKEAPHQEREGGEKLKSYTQLNTMLEEQVADTSACEGAHISCNRGPLTMTLPTRKTAQGVEFQTLRC